MTEATPWWADGEATGRAAHVVTYAELPDGAQITYATDDPTLVEAIPAWFDRQVMDHGDHAEEGQG